LKILKGLMAVVCLAVGGHAIAHADGAADFYRGKQLNLVVSTNSGNGIDTYGRMLARHIGRHVPGNPQMVVQNMPGAGGIRATNYMYNTAPRDGTYMALVHPAMTTAAVLTLSQARFDATKLTWIGNMEQEVALCVSWHESKIKTTEDMLTKEFVVGGTGAGSNLEIYPRVLNSILGAKIKIISGYSGGGDVALAIERHELDGRCGWPLSSIRSTRPAWLAEKKINILMQTGLAKDPDLPDVPLITDYAKTDKDLAVMKLIFIARSLLRPVLAPPDVPADRVATLRKAFMATMRDKEFIGEGERQGVTVRSPLSGEEVEAMILKLQETPKDVIERATQAMGTCDTCAVE
jgi:tripartite-type tricarboxylate transporter receptor subunit TctC